MILLDTNVISEPTKPLPNPNVMRWFSQQSHADLYLTTTSLAEIHVGLESLPDGRRKDLLRADTAQLISSLFGPRIVAFDEAAAVTYGSLLARLKKLRQQPFFGDGQIAAIALLHGFTLATRDTAPFLAAGLTVINPWQP